GLLDGGRMKWGSMGPKHWLFRLNSLPSSSTILTVAVTGLSPVLPMRHWAEYWVRGPEGAGLAIDSACARDAPDSKASAVRMAKALMMISCVLDEIGFGGAC